jgi:hypothetical protein
MNFVYLILFLLSVNILLTLAVFYKLTRNSKQLKEVVAHETDEVKKSVQNPVSASPSPNEATQEEEQIVSLDEQTPWQIPRDIKVEVEGSESVAPLGYEVTNATS